MPAAPLLGAVSFGSGSSHATHHLCGHTSVSPGVTSPLAPLAPGELTKADVLGVEVDDPDSEEDEADPDPAQPNGRVGSVARSAKSGRSHK